MYKRLMVLALVSILLALAANTQVTAFDSPVSPVSPIYTHVYLPIVGYDLYNTVPVKPTEMRPRPTSCPSCAW